jgi:exopolyphosphatase / guanosine-5'-triphosphate,3'-diphosphate pyrophosphatase
MRVAVIDVGTNTARLLVAEVTPDGAVVELDQQGAFLGLGDELGTDGTLRANKIAETAEVARGFAAHARHLAVERFETVVTAPGRGPGGHRLASALAASTGWPTRVLSADDEGRLAYDGAVARGFGLPEVVAVVDVGGGSSEIVVGTPLLGAAWVRSLTTGSLHLTRLLLAVDRPSRDAIEAARDIVRRALDGVQPPRPDVALAAGGSARAAAKVIGGTFDAGDLDELAKTAARKSHRELARAYDLRPSRARTLVAGAIVLAETARLLGRPLELARGGLREGTALALAASSAAATAA